MKRLLFALVCVLTLSMEGCVSNKSSLPADQSAYSVIPAQAPGEQQTGDYRIGPLDILAVTVFREPDLSLKDLQVDASGNLLYPLIGSIRAQDRTAAELSKEIAARLQKYLVDPQVSVVVTSSVSQQITVEGQVTQPGVYDIAGSTTLLRALAQAKSPTRVARLDQVVVFRTVNGQRTGAVFDVTKIRSGAAPDPQLVGGDLVVVGFSNVKGAFRDFLQGSALLNIFRVF